MIPLRLAVLVGMVLALTACSGSKTESAARPAPATPEYFKVDPATSASISGSVRFTGRKPARKAVDMSNDPACVKAHGERAFDESEVVNTDGTLANVFVYVKTGLEGKTFEVPATSAAIDQRGCWFRPRMLGMQVGQRLEVTNSDPVTHNIHPMAEVNREWNHSQGEGDAPLERKFLKPEVLIRVKCNIHSWMHALIGVTANPYFAVTGADGSFTLPNLPPGEYTIEAVHEKLGVQDQKITVGAKGAGVADFTFKGE